MDNAAVITKAFARMRTNKDAACRQSLRKVLSDAVVLALDLHEQDGGHSFHLAVGDDYGWAVYHDGVLVDMEVYTADGDPRGIVSERLRELSSGGLTDSAAGWTGVVMAGMQVMRYSFDFEEGILRAVSKDAAARLISKFISDYRRARR